MKSCLSRFALTFRAAVISISSDVPATRKICGLKSHSAVLGCSRCLKKFPGNFGEKRDFILDLIEALGFPVLVKNIGVKLSKCPRAKQRQSEI